MYDAFVSYSSKDREPAKRLATALMEKGINVWFDGWEMKPGQSLLEKITEAISESSYLFVLLSPSSVRSNWVRQEVRQAMTEEIYIDNVKVVPIILEKCDVPGFLKDKHYVDLTDNNPPDYNLQKLVDLVFENPRALDRPQFGKELFDNYYELLASSESSRSEVVSLGKQVARVVETHLIPSHEIGYPEGSYPKVKEMQAEVNLVLGRLREASDAYGCCCSYARENNEAELLFKSGLARFCVLCFMNEVNQAEEFLDKLYGMMSELIPENTSLNLDAILDAVVSTCFCENLGIENALETVYSGDHHLLNLRIERALGSLLKGFDKQEIKGRNVRLIIASLLEDYGLFRPAISLYKKALADGHTESAEKIKKAEESLRSTMEMAPYFSHGVYGGNPGQYKLTVNITNPRSLTRTLMCAGVYADVSDLVQDLQRSLREVRAPRREINVETNGRSPVRILVYEDCSGSAKGVVRALAELDVGVVTVRSKDQAKKALGKYRKILLYVSDHHFEYDGMVQISGAIFERDVLKKEYPGIRSTILTYKPDAQSPEEGVAYGFRKGGGDYVTDCRGKSDEDIAHALLKLVEQIETGAYNS